MFERHQKDMRHYNQKLVSSRSCCLVVRGQTKRVSDFISGQPLSGSSSFLSLMMFSAVSDCSDILFKGQGIRLNDWTELKENWMYKNVKTSSCLGKYGGWFSLQLRKHVVFQTPGSFKSYMNVIISYFINTGIIFNQKVYMQGSKETTCMDIYLQ